ncbi:zinc uptake protein ZrgA [Thalassobius sp. MITS945101]|uniref:zinc uptake protein ZrgA n=1 Tax=Thalassobius sp. MITS945101 TaxID=3096994 RepID=UPI00399BCA18
MRTPLPVLLTLCASPLWAESARQLDSHEHGVGALNIAIAGTTVEVEFHAPGADLVGFEYAAETPEDRAAVDGAVAALARPLELFQVPAAAACSVVEASAALETEDDHDAHDHDVHDDEHAHEEDHDHEAHEDHDDHGDDHDEDHGDALGEDHGDEHAHDHAAEHDAHDADHADHDEEAGHTEFHAHYVLTCAAPEALSEITFNYFKAFPNARELEVQIVSAVGAKAFEVHYDEPVLNLRGMF